MFAGDGAGASWCAAVVGVVRRRGGSVRAALWLDRALATRHVAPERDSASLAGIATSADHARVRCVFVPSARALRGDRLLCHSHVRRALFVRRFCRHQHRAQARLPHLKGRHEESLLQILG